MLRLCLVSAWVEVLLELLLLCYIVADNVVMQLP